MILFPERSHVKPHVPKRQERRAEPPLFGPIEDGGSSDKLIKVAPSRGTRAHYWCQQLGPPEPEGSRCVNVQSTAILAYSSLLRLRCRSWPLASTRHDLVVGRTYSVKKEDGK